jgi:hypothetical protein
MLSLQSSELGLPSLAEERRWGGPNSDEGTDTVILLVYMYIVAVWVNRNIKLYDKNNHKIYVFADYKLL